MAKAFQKMLQDFGLTEKIHTVHADNATSNNTQTTKLDQLDNTFEEENWVQCFNHTLQLSVKALLKPFNVGLSRKVTDDDNEFTQDNDGNPAMFEENDKDKGDEEEQGEDEDDEDNNIDELAVLSQDEQKQVPEETAIVHNTVTKVSSPISKQKMFTFSLLTIVLI